MSWELSDKERVKASALPPAERYGYFVSQITEHGEVWGLHGDGGWAVGETDLKERPATEEQDAVYRQALWVWPHPELAAACVKSHAPDSRPKRISLRGWMSQWLPGMAGDGLLVGIFPTATRLPVVVEPADHRADLEEEGVQEADLAEPCDGEGGWPAIKIQNDRRAPRARRGALILVDPVDDGLGIATALKAALAAARQQGHHVVFLRRPDATLHPDLAPGQGEPVLDLPHPDGFWDTALLTWLRERGVTAVYIGGTRTEHGVDATVRRARQLGFETHLLRDGHATRDSDVLSAAQIVAHHNHCLARYATLVAAATLAE